MSLPRAPRDWRLELSLVHGQVSLLIRAVFSLSLKEPLLAGSIAPSARFDLAFRHIGCPDNAVFPYEVVGPTREVPIPDGWIERNSLAVEDQNPVCRSDRSYNTLTATATASVGSGAVFHRYVHHAIHKF